MMPARTVIQRVGVMGICRTATRRIFVLPVSRAGIPATHSKLIVHRRSSTQVTSATNNLQNARMVLSRPKEVMGDWEYLTHEDAVTMALHDRTPYVASTACDGEFQEPSRDDVHPVKCTYASLPCPPFLYNARQAEAVSYLAAIYDRVVSDWENGVQNKVSRVQPKPKAAHQNAGNGILGFFTWASDRTPPKKAPAPKRFVPPNYTASKGLYLYGTSGAGKTVLLNVFFRCLPHDFPVIRLHWHEFVRDAFRYMHELPKQSVGKRQADVFAMIAQQIAGHCRVFLLDEILITHVSEAVLVKELFRCMWMQGITIITTSNYMHDELYMDGFNRDQFLEFIPELQERMPMFDMMATEDYRTVGVESSDAFLVGFTSENTAALEMEFGERCGGEQLVDHMLPIPWEGRAIHVPLCNNDRRVAKFDFDDLCRKPLGRADYALIATHYDAIFLDKVPKLSVDDGVEFKRFVSLVDIMYDKKVALHCLSEVPCDELYNATADMHIDEQLAWKRCQSMLTEMSSMKYSHMASLMRNHLVQGNATAF